MAFVSVSSLSKQFGATHVLDHVNFKARHGEFVVFFGPNGCGKTTLAYILAGLETPDSGRVRIAGKPASEARAGFVFQNYHEALFPYRTVKANVEFGLEMMKIPHNDRIAIAEKWLHEAGLNGLANRYPYQLSGGQKQLTAIARALAPDPDVLLMDEPFSALDYSTRTRMEETIQRIWLGTKKTTLFISHDIDEAVFLADRVIVLSKLPGRVVKEIKVSLPRPRTAEMRLGERFHVLRNKVITAFQAGVDEQ